jgi:hypothetical protein
MSKVALQLERAVRNDFKVSILRDGLMGDVEVIAQPEGLVKPIVKHVHLPLEDHFTDEKLGNYLNLLITDVEKEVFAYWQAKRQSAK